MAFDLSTWRQTGYTVTVDMAHLERWNAAFPDVHARLQALETWETTLETLIQDVRATASALIQNSVGPNLAAVNAAIADAQLAIADIIIGGTAIDSARLGNQLPAHYLDLVNATGTLAREKFALTFSDWIVANVIGAGSAAAVRMAIGAISAGEVVSGYAPTVHTHDQTAITGLVSALNSKAPVADPNFTGLARVDTALIYTSQTVPKQTNAQWVAGTSSDEAVISPLLLKAAIEALAPQGLGIGQTWQNVLPWRLKETKYHNNTGKPIMVVINADWTEMKNPAFEVSVNGAFLGEQVPVGTYNKYITTVQLIPVIIPPWHWYRIMGAEWLNSWVELR